MLTSFQQCSVQSSSRSSTTGNLFRISASCSGLISRPKTEDNNKGLGQGALQGLGAEANNIFRSLCNDDNDDDLDDDAFLELPSSQLPNSNCDRLLSEVNNNSPKHSINVSSQGHSMTSQAFNMTSQGHIMNSQGHAITPTSTHSQTLQSTTSLASYHTSNIKMTSQSINHSPHSTRLHKPTRKHSARLHSDPGFSHSRHASFTSGDEQYFRRTMSNPNEIRGQKGQVVQSYPGKKKSALDDLIRKNNDRQLLLL